MLQFKGFMDQITPSAANIANMWRATPAEINSVIDGLLAEMSFDHYTFYTKWYTNGWDSKLPFLVNDPDNLNVRSGNRAFAEVIDHLHERGLSVGAMLQIYTYEAEAWGEAGRLKTWEIGPTTARERTQILADPTTSLYHGRLWALVAEHMRLFPQVDYVFVEGEGLYAEQIRMPLARWLAERGGPDLEHLTYADEDVAYCERLGLPLDITWSREGMEFAVEYGRANLAVIEDALRANGYRGQIGLVYHTYNVESRYMDRVLLQPDWWLLPWHYFGWDKDLPTYRARLDACKEHMLAMKQRGRRVCYLGDATIAWGFEPPIRELWQLTAEHLDAYLAMGTPEERIGLRWVGVTPEMIAGARRLYREVIFPR